jgi:hypothetical protein
MSCRLALLATVAAVVLTCPLHAEPLAPVQAQTVDPAHWRGSHITPWSLMVIA